MTIPRARDEANPCVLGETWFGSSWMVACAASSKERFCALLHAFSMACPCLGRNGSGGSPLSRLPKRKRLGPDKSNAFGEGARCDARSIQTYVEFGCTLMRLSCSHSNRAK